MHKLSKSMLALGLLVCAGSAMAHQPGDMVLRVGAAMVDPQDDSSTLRVNGTSVDGTSVSVDNDTQLGLTFTYMLREHIGLEVLAATPFSHEVTAHGLGDDLKTAEVTHLPPTVSVQYYPMEAGAAFQPYVGVGVNYTLFFDEELTSDFKGAMGDGKIKLDNSFGAAFQLGVDYQLTDNLVVNAAVWKIGIDTTATIDLDSGAQIKTDVDIDPLVYMVGVGYKF
ncbi:Outer membrane protein W [Hahella chejuensis KCTC 2396]|uniref:Outer membrane protein W n=1 Tax=Hahella chejuensis (strain KCTC 2396) TaxID=349521 RepID=Q2SG92_HAHCH|nr:OmpW family outer membrane protein [Hahella chejuensis]ABC30332.1 Outer membrane protein W [Hahella chejuensis KCTC 2396]